MEGALVRCVYATCSINNLGGYLLNVVHNRLFIS